MTGPVPGEGGVERGVRYYDIDDTLVRVVGHGLPETLRDGPWVRYSNLAKFAYEALAIPCQEFQAREAAAHRSREERGAGARPASSTSAAASRATAPVCGRVRRLPHWGA